MCPGAGFVHGGQNQNCRDGLREGNTAGEAAGVPPPLQGLRPLLASSR